MAQGSGTLSLVLLYLIQSEPIRFVKVMRLQLVLPLKGHYQKITPSHHSRKKNAPMARSLNT